MRIAQCNDAFLPIMDGVSRVVYEYAHEIGRRGHESYVIAPMSQAGYRAKYPFEILDFLSIKLPGASQYRTGVATMDRHYITRMDTVKLDLVHIHSPGPAGMEAVRLADKQHIPLVGTFHTRYYEDLLRLTRNEGLATLGLKYIVDFYDRCDEVWTVSNAAQSELRDYGYKKHIEIIPHGTRQVDITHADMDRACAAFSLDERPMLLYVGQIDWKKNLRLSLQAAARLKERGMAFQFVLAGKGASMEPLQEYVRELGLLNEIKLVGHITDSKLLSALYRHAALFVFPSSYDTAGLVVREAAIEGTPSVVLAGSAPGECIVHGESGFTCEDDVESLCNVLESALVNHEQTRRIGEAARTNIPICWDSVLDEVEARYTALVAKEKFLLRRKRGLFRKELETVDKNLEKRKASMLLRFINQDMQNIYAYGYTPQKPMPKHMRDEKPLARATPESQGISSRDLLAFYHTVDADIPAGIQAMMALRNGKIIAEGYWAPYEKTLPHQLFSTSKSITSTAIGMLVDDGLLRLNERIVDLFADKVTDPQTHPMKDVTVWHILTMSTGVRFDEIGSALGMDWEQEFLDSGVRFAPGTQFHYNSMNTYMLAAIVCRKTGATMMEYLQNRLFGPLSICSATWETCPRGIEKGGWGLSLTMEDAAKIGQLYLNMGAWEVDGASRQIISSEWIQQATSQQIKTPNGECIDGYGYQIWMAPMQGSYLFNGAFGQYLIVLPDKNALVAVFSGSSRLFAKGDLALHTQQCFANATDTPLVENKTEQRMLEGALQNLSVLDRQNLNDMQALPMPLPWIKEHINGHSYSFPPNVSGLFPMVIQCLHNNFSVGVSHIVFRSDDSGMLSVVIQEGETKNELLIPPSGAERMAVIIRQERHEVALSACAGVTAQGDAILRLYVYFLETPSTRILTFRFSDGKVHVTIDENPSTKDAMGMLLELSGMTQWELYRAITPMLKRERTQNRIRSYVTTAVVGVLTEETEL